MMEEYQNLIFSICYKMTADYFAAQDLTQDTFLAALRHLSSAPPGAEKKWLCRIATNRCLDYLKSAGYQTKPQETELLDQHPSGQSLPEEITLEHQERERLKLRCAALKPPYDEIAMSYFYDEESPNEIAARLEANPKTVRTQIYRAREMLRAVYRRDWEPEEAPENGQSVPHEKERSGSCEEERDVSSKGRKPQRVWERRKAL